MAIIFYLYNSYTETAVRYVGLLYMIEVTAHSLKSYQNMEKMLKTMRSPRQRRAGRKGWVVVELVVVKKVKGRKLGNTKCSACYCGLRMVCIQ